MFILINYKWIDSDNQTVNRHILFVSAFQSYKYLPVFL